MSSSSTRSLIVKVSVGLVVSLVGLIGLMAGRAGMYELSPTNIFKGVFLLIIGGAIFNVLAAYTAAPQETSEAVTDCEGRE